MKEILKIALEAVESKKAVDVVLMDISGIASFASFFLICSGENARQIQAIADEVEMKLRAEGHTPDHIEGYKNAEWVLLDYAALVVHIFSKHARSYYDLERLWRDAKIVDTRKLLQARTRKAPVKKGGKRNPAKTAG